MEKKLTLQEIFNRIQDMFGYDMETEEVTEFAMRSLINDVFASKEKTYDGLMDDEFVVELRKILPNDPSETEIEIALNDYHNGMDIDSIVDHLIWG